MTARVLLCRCEDVTLDEVEDAIAAGQTDLESVKRYTGFGTGWCQGKQCVVACARVLAARTGDMPLAKLLLELGADPALTNADGSSALLAAAGIGDLGSGDESAGTEDEAIAMVGLLLKAGLDINIVDENGETAMHGAAYQNWPKLIAFLADHGAEVKIWHRKNRWGWTPLLIAQGYRKGNFRPDVATITTLERIMRAAGVTPPAPGKDVTANQQSWDQKKPEPKKPEGKKPELKKSDEMKPDEKGAAPKTP